MASLSGFVLGCWWPHRMSLGVYPLSVVSFVNIFSVSEGYLFILFMASFAAWKIYVLLRSHLFIFVCISITLGDESKKILL